MSEYRVLREPRHETLRLRGLDMRVTRWGSDRARPPLILLHGWLDAGATFQFLADAFRGERALAALDWRGFGRSEWSEQGYWFPDYLGDLDAFLEAMSPGEPARLVGHSMGGNIAALYAGIRPDRVRCLVNLEGIGLSRTSPDQAPGRYGKWLEQLRAGPVPRSYASFDELRGVIRMRYPRFSEAQAAFVAHAWGTLDDGGRVRLAADPRHHWVNPILYKREDAESCWHGIRAPLLLVMGAESDAPARLGADGTAAALSGAFPQAEIATVPGAGHMLHIESPERVAALIEAFVEAH